MIRFFVFFCFGCFFVTGFSQSLQWARTIGGQQTQDVRGLATDPSGNVYAVGSFVGELRIAGNFISLSRGKDIWFAKFSSAGALLWARVLTNVGGAQGDDTGTDIAVDGTGKVYITGGFTSALNFNPAGNVTFPVQSNNEWAFIATYDTNGNYLSAFPVASAASTNPSNMFSRGEGIDLDGSGNIYVAGRFRPIFNPGGVTVEGNFNWGGTEARLNSTNGQGFFAKYSPTNQYMWAHNVGNAGANTTSEIFDVTIGPNSSVFLCGRFQGTSIDFNPLGSAPAFNSANGSAFVARFSTNGAYEWARAIGLGANSFLDDEAYEVDIDGAGNSYVAVFNGLTSQADIRVVKINPAGNISQSMIVVNPGGFDGALGLEVQSDGNVFITGTVRRVSSNPINFNPLGTPKDVILPANTQDAFYARYNSNLLLSYVRTLGLNAIGDNTGRAAVKRFGNNLIVAGSFAGSTDFDICFTNTTYLATGFDGFLLTASAENPALVVTGPDFVCQSSNAQFSVQNRPAGMNFSWSSNPLGAVTPQNAFGETFTVNATSYRGWATIGAQPNASGDCSATVTPKSIWVGTPQITSQIVYVLGSYGVNPITLNRLATYNFLMEPVPGASFYNWQTSPGFDRVINSNGLTSAYFTTPFDDGVYGVSCAAENICGTGGAAGLTVVISSDGGGGGGVILSVTASPNPTSQSLRIKWDKSKAIKLADKSAKRNSDLIQYSLFDETGATVLSFSSPHEEDIVDVSSLKKGRYVLVARFGGETEKTRIVIQ